MESREGSQMRPTEWLQETRKMRFEAVLKGYRRERLAQSVHPLHHHTTAPVPGWRHEHWQPFRSRCEQILTAHQHHNMHLHTKMPLIMLFLIWCISVSRFLSSCLVGGSAAISVASTIVSLRRNSPRSAGRTLIVLKMDSVRWCSSSKCRNLSSVVASGAASRVRSLPTKRRIAWLSYMASPVPSSDRPTNWPAAKWDSMEQGYLSAISTEQSLQFRPKNDLGCVRFFFAAYICQFRKAWLHQFISYYQYNVFYLSSRSGWRHSGYPNGLKDD